LRRKLTRCNREEIATIKTGLKLKKGGEKVIDFEGLKNEKALRTMIEKNLKKEIHPGTKPSIDFIFKILEDAYNSGMKYDVSDMRPAITAVASHSTNHSYYCIKLVTQMPVFENDKHRKAWLLTVAANLSKNRIEYNRVRDTAELNEELAGAEEEDRNVSDDLSAIWKAVEQLPVNQREAIHLFYQEGYKTAEIAEITGRAEATIRSDLKRGRDKLKSILKEADDFE
jgi:RNA polymerase sigma factor (sigma-70 family)